MLDSETTASSLDSFAWEEEQEPAEWAVKHINMRLSHEAHARAKRAVFMSNTMVIAISYILNQALSLFVNDTAKKLGLHSPAATVVVQVVRAIIVSLASVPAEWFLCRAAGEGGSFWKHAFALARDTPSWLFAWSWNGALFAFLRYYGIVFWGEFLSAVGSTVLIALWQSTGCYRRGVAEVSQGGHHDTLRARYKAMPQAFTFSLAVAWWNVLNVPLATWMTNPIHPGWTALAALVYWFFIHKFVGYFVQRFGSQGAFEAVGEAEDHDLERIQTFDDLVHDIRSVGANFEILMNGVAGFVLGNGWCDVLGKLFFGVIWECKDATSCGLGANLVVAVVTSLAALQTSVTIEEQNLVSKRLAPYTAMIGKTLIFVAGGSIMTFAQRMIEHFSQEVGEGTLEFEEIGFAVVLWLLCSEGYQTYVAHCRLMDRRGELFQNKKQCGNAMCE